MDNNINSRLIQITASGNECGATNILISDKIKLHRVDTLSGRLFELRLTPPPHLIDYFILANRLPQQQTNKCDALSWKNYPSDRL